MILKSKRFVVRVSPPKEVRLVKSWQLRAAGRSALVSWLLLLLLLLLFVVVTGDEERIAITTKEGKECLL